jgi:hypothetical protein
VTKGIWRYGVVVTGIKKRCRKVERHISANGNGTDLGETSEAPSEETARVLAKAWIAENMKTVVKAYATATYWENDGHGFLSWQPFEEAHNVRWLL